MHDGYAECHAGIHRMIRLFGGHDLELTDVRVGNENDYGNFRLLEDVVIEAVDRECGQPVEILNVATLIERSNAYKVFIYKD